MSHFIEFSRGFLRTEDGSQSAEWLIKSADSKHHDNYHQNFNAKNFMKMMKENFLPTHRAVHGDKHAIIVLDNAPYHKARVDGFNIRGSKITKAQLIEFAKKQRIKEITVPVMVKGVFENRKWKQSQFNKNANPRSKTRGPNRKELQTGLISECHKREDLGKFLRTDLEQFAHENNITLIFTPPNHPELQPIELLWALTKNAVRDWFRWGRTQNDLMQEARVRWYGNSVKDGSEGDDVDGKDGISVETIQSLIKHAWKEANKWCKDLGLKVTDVYDFYNPADEEPPQWSADTDENHVQMRDNTENLVMNPVDDGDVTDESRDDNEN